MALDVGLLERIYGQTTKTATCWVFNGHLNDRGYGKISVRSKPTLVHRIVYAAERGPIPAGGCILHRCDNPQCINPGHLFLGTRGDNNRDMAQKGRARNQHETRTICLHGHPLDGVRKVGRTGRLTRYCVACQRIANRLYRFRLRQERLAM